MASITFKNVKKTNFEPEGNSEIKEEVTIKEEQVNEEKKEEIIIANNEKEENNIIFNKTSPSKPFFV